MTNEQEIVRSVFDAYIRDAKATSTKKDRPTFDMLEEVKNRAIKALEQPTPRWIPVSRELPKENGWYECTVNLNDSLQTMELFYKNGKWLDNRRINMFDTYDIYGYGNTKEKHKLSYQELISEFEWNQVVIAWQPLPKAYEEK